MKTRAIRWVGRAGLAAALCAAGALGLVAGGAAARRNTLPMPGAELVGAWATLGTDGERVALAGSAHELRHLLFLAENGLAAPEREGSTLLWHPGGARVRVVRVDLDLALVEIGGRPVWAPLAEIRPQPAMGLPETPPAKGD